MYEAHWGLTRSPFQNVPDPAFFFPSSQHREGLARLLYAVRYGKGAAMLTGAVGCGKTTLARAFVVQLNQAHYDVGLITNPALPRAEFLAEVNQQFGLPPSGNGKVDLLHRFNEHLAENRRADRETVLIVDEGQAILERAVFEELRLLLNFQLNDRFLLTLVLMGQPELTQMVGAVEQFAQRIAIRFHLKGLDEKEMRQYIAFRLERAGVERPLFTEEALELIWERTRGVPRLINTLCDLGLLEGFASRASIVDGPVVRRALASL